MFVNHYKLVSEPYLFPLLSFYLCHLLYTLKVFDHVIMTTSTIKQDDGSNIFSLWKMKMLALLGNLGLNEALAGEAQMTTSYTKEKKEIMKKVYSTFIHSLGDKVLRKVSKIKTAADIWLKLESLYDQEFVK